MNAYEIERNREIAKQLEESGYKIEANSNGYRVFYNDTFLCGAGVKLPREKRLHWKVAMTCMHENFYIAILEAKKHAKENNIQWGRR